MVCHWFLVREKQSAFLSWNNPLQQGSETASFLNFKLRQRVGRSSSKDLNGECFILRKNIILPTESIALGRHRTVGHTIPKHRDPHVYVSPTD